MVLYFLMTKHIAIAIDRRSIQTLFNLIIQLHNDDERELDVEIIVQFTHLPFNFPSILIKKSALLSNAVIHQFS